MTYTRATLKPPFTVEPPDAGPPGATRSSGEAPAGFPPPSEWLALVHAALGEDLGPAQGERPTPDGDVTSRTSVPGEARARARLVAKADGVLAGMPLFLEVFRFCDPAVSFDLRAADADEVVTGQLVCVVEGNARCMLAAERTALNLLQRLSGIATLTHTLVREAGDRLRVLDTRKTTPGWRALEKYAVLCGGGHNHRFGLFDEVLLKENHIALAGRPVEEVLRAQRAELGDEMHIVAEARDDEEARAVVRGGADVVLLDNREPEDVARLVPELRALAQERGRALAIEVSGGIDIRRLAAFAACGVDRASVGALTHSAPALDLSLLLEPAPPDSGARA